MSDTDQRLEWQLIAETGGFTRPIREAQQAAEQAADKITASMESATSATESLNKATASGFTEQIQDAAAVSEASARTINQSLGSVQQTVQQLNATSTSAFSDSMNQAATAAEQATARIARSEAERQAIRDRLRAQMGGDRSDSFQTEDERIGSRSYGMQPRYVRNAYKAQYDRNDASDEIARANQLSSLRADILARSAQQASISAQAEAHLAAALGLETTAAESASVANAAFAVSQDGVAASSEHMVSPLVKSDAVIRLFESGSLNGVRAAGVFLTSIRGMSAVLETAFPIIGALALGSALVKMASDAYHATDNFVTLKSAIEAIKSEDIEINVRLNADQSTIEANAEQILKDNLATKANPNAGDPAVRRMHLAYLQRQPVDISDYFHSSAYANAPNDIKGKGANAYESLYGRVSPSQLPDRLNQIDREVATLQQRIAEGDDNGHILYHADVDGRGPSFGRDARDYLETRLRMAQQIQARLHSSANVQASDIQVTQSEIGAYQRNGAPGTARAATSAAELQYKRLTNYANSQRALYGDDIWHAKPYWAQHLHDFGPDTDQYRDIQAKLADDNQSPPNTIWTRYRQLANRNAKRAAEDTQHLNTQDDLGTTLSREQAQDVLHTGPRYTDFRKDQYEQQQQPGSTALALQSAQLQIDKSTGSISRYAAAVEQARINQQSFTQQLASLKQQLSDLPNQGLDSQQLQTQTIALQNQIANLTKERMVQTMQDVAAISQTTLTTAWKNSLNTFVQESQDAAQQIGNIFTNVLGGINGNLATAFTAHYRTNHERMYALRSGLSDTVRGTANHITQYGLQRAEGTALHAFGFGGKPDGTSNNPLYVRIVGAINAAAQSAGGAIQSAGKMAGGILGSAGKFFGLGGGSVPSLSNSDGYDPLNLNAPDTSTVQTALGAGSVDKALGKTILGFQGFFASGGDMVANMPSVVGENGPELFVPKTSGTMVPNHQLGSMGQPMIHFNPVIDARGSSDPAQTQAIVNRSLQQALPHFVAAANQSRTASNKRSPSNLRV